MPKPESHPCCSGVVTSGLKWQWDVSKIDVTKVMTQIYAISMGHHDEHTLMQLVPLLETLTLTLIHNQVPATNPRITRNNSTL
jgi:hypothetical protein